MPDPVVLVPLMTTAGLLAVYNEAHDGLQAQITHIALGDGAYTPAANRTALANERVRVAVASGELVTGTTQIHLTGIVTAGSPEFYVREIGFFLSDGTLLAVWSHLTQMLAWRSAQSDLLLAFDLTLSGIPAGSVSVTETGALYLSPATPTRLGSLRLGTAPEVAAGVADGAVAVIPSTLAGVLALLPIYPEVETAGNLLTLAAGSGTLIIGAGQTWLWRGHRRYSSDDYLLAARTLAHSASKTYHLRWSGSGGFVLRDLANSTYNPTAAGEDDPRFDTTYDDMLIARVVTSAGNVATVTGRANAVRLKAEFASTGPAYSILNESYQYACTFSVNWARTPQLGSVYAVVYQQGGAVLSGGANYGRAVAASRAAVVVSVQSDWFAEASNPLSTVAVSIHA